MPRNLTLLVVVAIVACAGPGSSLGDVASGRIDFKDRGWAMHDNSTVVLEDFMGQTALRLQAGKVSFGDVELQDGTIEFDLAVTPYRSFVFIEFRIEEEGEHEEIYFRPHKSLLPDAIQYTPVYSGRGQWQLYHDSWSTAAAPLPAAEWIHVKLVVYSQLAAVFVGDMDSPRLLTELARRAAPGHIALQARLPVAGGPEGVHIASFANLEVRPGDVDQSFFPNFEATHVPEERVRTWQLSPTFVPAEGAVRELPADILASPDWRLVGTTLRDGFVEVERHVTRPKGARRAAVLARLRIATAEPTTRRLDLGFSDEVSVFLNGRLIVSANDDYSFNDPRRQGLLNLDQLAVYLPLEKGDNDLVLAVTDRFGGWGLAGQFEDIAELTIEPR